MSKADVRLDQSAISTEKIPTKLQTSHQWVCWTEGEDGGKSGINPTSGDSLTSLNEGTSLNEAEHSVEAEDHDGVALVVNEDGGYVGVRLLDVVEGPSYNPDIDDWAEDVLDSIESYAEVSDNGKDIVLLAEGDLPDDHFESEKIRFTEKGIIPITGNALEDSAPVQYREEELVSVFEEHNQHEADNTESEAVTLEEDVTLSDVRETVVKNFDEAQWHLTESILSTHATLFINGIQNCAGLIVVGQSGAGKTTALKFFEGLDEQFYRSDEVTPASFVSHDASRTGEELEEIDLLPRIKHKSVLCHDMATWFGTDRETIREKMSKMTHLMDGEGLTRDSGSHGKRGYEGDYRFSFIGASTPLKPRAWDVMGNAGYRFVFYHKEQRPDDHQTVKNNLFGESSYAEKVEECRQKVQSFLHRLWTENGGYGSISDDEITFSDDAQDAIVYLGNLVKFSRATLSEGSDEDNPIVSREDPHRIGAVLRDITKGRTLLNGETTVGVDDVIVSARIALSTMPNKRRPLVRALLNPANNGQLTRNEVQDALDVSKPTALDRMELMDTLGIAVFTEVEDDGRGTKKLELKEEFQWPDILPFPDR